MLSISEDEIAKGSGRSVAGINLLAILENCQDLLISFGGHPVALGLKIKSSMISIFRKRVSALLKQQLQMNPDLAQARRMVDLTISLDQINPDLLYYLKCMEPFGEGNPKPVFFCSPVYLVGPPNVMGKDGTHLYFFVEQNQLQFRCVAFNMRERIKELQHIASHKLPMHLIFHPEYNEFGNRKTIELYIQDFSESLENLLIQPPPVSCETPS